MAKRKEFPQRKQNTSLLKDAIDDMLKTYRLEGKYREAEIISSWEDMMGKPIATRTRRMFFRDRKLFIELTSAPLKQELTLSKSKMILMLTEKFGPGAVDDIVFL